MSSYQIKPEEAIAILIGNSEYHELNNIFPSKGNIKAIKEALLDPGVFGIHSDRLLTIQNKESNQTKREIIQFLGKFHKKDVNVIIFYFSGHGYRRADRTYFLCTVDTYPELVDEDGSTAVSFEFVINRIRKARIPQRIIILDACYSGLAAMSDTNKFENFDLKGSCVITSSEEREPSYFNTEAEQTNFTGELIKLLQEGVGEQETISIEQLFFTLRDNVTSKNPKMLPQKRYNLGIPEHQYHLFKNKKYISPHTNTIIGERQAIPDPNQLTIILGYTDENKIRQESLKYMAKYAPDSLEDLNALVQLNYKDDLCILYALLMMIKKLYQYQFYPYEETISIILDIPFSGVPSLKYIAKWCLFYLANGQSRYPGVLTLNEEMASKYFQLLREESSSMSAKYIIHFLSKSVEGYLWPKVEIACLKRIIGGESNNVNWFESEFMTVEFRRILRQNTIGRETKKCLYLGLGRNGGLLKVDSPHLTDIALDDSNDAEERMEALLYLSQWETYIREDDFYKLFSDEKLSFYAVLAMLGGNRKAFANQLIYDRQANMVARGVGLCIISREKPKFLEEFNEYYSFDHDDILDSILGLVRDRKSINVYLDLEQKCYELLYQDHVSDFIRAYYTETLVRGKEAWYLFDIDRNREFAYLIHLYREDNKPVSVSNFGAITLDKGWGKASRSKKEEISQKYNIVFSN